MDPVHLGWFSSGFGISGWDRPGQGTGYPPFAPHLFTDVVRTLERGGFEFVVLEDSSVVPDAYGGNPDYYLARGMMAPKLDPVPLVPYLAAATSRIGLVPTLTTGFYPPWLLARLMTTLDHLTGGRIGWNVVTATTAGAWENYGMTQPEHDRRYDLADEFVDVAQRLWASFPASAEVLDHEAGVAFSADGVGPVDFEGEFFSSRGPLNAPGGPQGSPVLFQAGGSPRGRRFAARRAEAVIASCSSVEDMKEYRADVREAAAAAGRDPNAVRVFFLVSAVLGDTEQEAAARNGRRLAAARAHLVPVLAGLSTVAATDLSGVDLDAPVPPLSTNGSQSVLRELLRDAPAGATLREVLEARAGSGGMTFVGTPDGVAAQLADVLTETGGDGILFGPGAAQRPHLGDAVEIVDRLVPVLRRHGVVSADLPRGNTFRARLTAF